MGQPIVLESSQHVYAFAPEMTPAGFADSGAIVLFKTADAFNGQITSPDDTLAELNFDAVNPATGPLHVKNAQPGDILAVDILHMSTGTTGIILTVPGSGVLRAMTDAVTRIVKIGAHWIQFSDQVRIAKQPMMGVIGVATKEQRIPTGTPGRHGGNMDTRDIAAGATLYLPVFQEGGLLAMGDAHAAMGDGEVSGTGVECTSETLVRVRVLKNQSLDWPWLDNQKERMVIVSAESLDDATGEATEQMVRHLAQALDKGLDEAYMLMSSAGSLRISQVVDPLVTVRATIPRLYLD